MNDSAPLAATCNDVVEAIRAWKNLYAGSTRRAALVVRAGDTFIDYVQVGHASARAIFVSAAQHGPVYISVDGDTTLIDVNPQP